MIYTIFFLTLICFAGFYSWTKCLVGILLAIGIMNCAMKGKKKLNLPLFSPLIFLLITMLVSVWAIDKSRNTEGIITAVVILEFFVFISVCNREEKEKLVNIIPISSAVMIIVSLVALLIPNIPLKLWQADRMGGIFQYSNTCALYFLISIIIEASAERKNKHLHYGTICLLVLGLLLTGSRSIAILLIAWGIYQFFAFANQRKALLLIGGLAVIAVIAGALILNNTQNIGRLATIVDSNSTVWGRLLYNLDGLKMLISHPFGMGYMGYYYVQGSVQTGVYSSMFVHNDLLQMGLDYGIAALLLFLAFVLYQLFKGKSGSLYKTLIIVIMVSGLMDFHLQYLSIVMILIMCFDMECELPYLDKLLKKNTDKKKKPDNTVAIIISSLLVIAGTYFAIAYGCLEVGNNQTAMKMLAGNSKALESELDNVSTAEETEVLALKLIKVNKYSKKAWRYKAYADVSQADYNAALDSIDRAIGLDRYNISLYQAFDDLLTDMEVLTENGDQTIYSRTVEMKNSLPQRLIKLEKETSPLAYKLKDKPEFDYKK